MFTARDDAQNTNECVFDVIVRSTDNSIVREETLPTGTFALTSDEVEQLRLAYFSHHLVSKGGDVSSFTVRTCLHGGDVCLHSS